MKPSFWPDVYHELISQIRATLDRQLDPIYYAQTQERVDISTETDVARILIVTYVKTKLKPIERHAEQEPSHRSGLELSETHLVETFLDE